MSTSPSNSHGRRRRVGLLVLLIIAALFATGALFIRYKLELLRAAIQPRAELWTGVHVSVQSLQVDGLRGFRAENLHATLDIPGGPLLGVSVPVARIRVDMLDLLSGRLTVDRVQVDNAALRLERPSGRRWFIQNSQDAGSPQRRSPLDSFRIVGKGCTLEAINVVGETRFDLEDFDFDVSRLADSPDLTAKLFGAIGGQPEKQVKVDLRFTSPEDFDLRVQGTRITPDEVNVFLPASQGFVQAGVAHASLRVAGYPDKTLALSLEAPFEGLDVRNGPEFFGPFTGSLTALANYSGSTRQLTLVTARADTNQISGILEGSVSFEDVPPRFDLRLEATRLPIANVINTFMPGHVEEYGQLDLVLQEPYQVGITLQGTAASPVISAYANVSAGDLVFAPKDTQYPQGSLHLTGIRGMWDSATQMRSLALSITDGEIAHPSSGVTATKISGTVTLNDKQLQAKAINAEVTGNSLVGELSYDFESGQGELSASGAISGLENTLLASAIHQTTLSGSGGFRCRALKEGNVFTVDADVDATQTQIDYSWWFQKAPGIGATAQVHAQMVPSKSISVKTSGELATSPFTATANLVYDPKRKKKWMLQNSEASADTLDVPAIGKCINVPYRISGGTASSAHFLWKRIEGATDAWESEGQCLIDDVALLPNGGDTPIHCSGLDVQGRWTRGPESTGTLSLAAKDASTPPLKGVWFVPLRTDPALLEKFPPVDRSWSYSLKAESLEVPPWKGTDFVGQAYKNAQGNGLNAYGADIEGGRLDGTYHSNSADNAYRATVTWTDIPASYFLHHFHYPEVLTGRISGNVAYSLDRDDPQTLDGKGHFDIKDGQFSADFLLSRFESDVSALPPSLKFGLVDADVEFQKDIVRTPKIELQAQGLRMEGSGQFVRDGDMDYDIKVSVSPAVAEVIPALRDNFNIQGHRLAQQDIELAFKITGPTFNPSSELAALPSASVTLVSGALEVTSEAMKVIDIPRKILVDLLKIGGGIMGAGK